MDELNRIEARYMLLRPKIAGVVDLYKNQVLLAEIQLLIKDIAAFLERNRRKAKTPQILAQNQQLVTFREYLQNQLK